MDSKQLFKKYRQRLVKEGILKSALLAFAAAFGAVFISALGCWLGGYLKVWLPLVIGAAVFIALLPALYFTMFKPTAKGIARKVDSLGLEERLITMLELEKDPSYMAMRQREDAKQKLSAVQAKSIKFALSRTVIAIVSVLFVFAAGMTTITGLAAAGIMPGGNELLPGFNDRFLEVTYVVDEGGEIQGEADQLVLPGENATPVMAVAEDGWIFLGWDDGTASPFRTDEKIEESLIITAMFERVDEADEDPEAGGGGEGDDEEAPDGDGMGSGEGSGESDNGSSDSGSSGEGNGSGEGGEEGEGDGKGQGNGAGGKYEEKNQVIDDQTYYRDVYEEYYQRVKEALESGRELTDEEREMMEFIEKYYGSLS